MGTGQGGGALAEPQYSYVISSPSPAATPGAGSGICSASRGPCPSSPYQHPWGSSSPQGMLSGVRLAARALLAA